MMLMLSHISKIVNVVVNVCPPADFRISNISVLFKLLKDFKISNLIFIKTFNSLISTTF